MLDNPRHERFAHLLAAGKNQVQAYVGAGYRGGRAEASRLATNPIISQRIDELLEPAAEAVQVAAFDAVLSLTAAAQAALDRIETAAAAAAERGDCRGLVAGACEALKLAEVLSTRVGNRVAVMGRDERRARIEELLARFEP